jgi:immune inhibitor A
MLSHDPEEAVCHSRRPGPSDRVRELQPSAPLADLAAIYRAADASEDGRRCMVAPAPPLREQVGEALRRAKEAGVSLPGHRVRLRPPDRLGLNDGLIIPGTKFPLGTSPSRVRRQAADRAPLRGPLQVIIVLVEFSDQRMQAGPERFEELFFSEGTMPAGSVRDYFRQVTNGLVDIQGAVVGPYELPETLETYAGGESGMRDELPNARTMARHAAEASNPDVDFGPYDNDGNGHVDAFVVVHAGPDGAETGRGSDIWSHKWVIEGEEYDADGTFIYGYLTIPEDARLGVCAHELGHLLFGWPDLYDIDNSSNGIGDWCLMASGSWSGTPPGDTPAHPSAWCKADQGWVDVVKQAKDEVTTIPDVKDARTVWRLWTGGQESPEYFLVENRRRAGFDEFLPGEGLLVWHIDDSTEDNSNENHYKVALVQADALRDLETRADAGDAGDPFPGSGDNRVFTDESSPSSKSYAGAETFVSITEISDPAAEMSARFAVSDGLAEAE